MAHLSTLRPLPQRLLERLWLLLSGHVPTCIEYPMTMNALNDDCLLLLLDTLTMPQLLQLRGVSRRFCHLIEGHSLRKFRTLIFSNDEKRKKKTSKELPGKGTIQMFFASRWDAEKEFGRPAIHFWYWARHLFPASKLVPLQFNAWPLSLPLLLPRLSCLTLEHFLINQVEPLTEEHLSVNRRFIPYLNSNWSSTLTTLHLYIHVSPKPEPDNSSFAQLNQLSNLKHLILEFSRLPEPESSSFLLPDSMPVFGQLQSFLLHNYGGSNTATLLHQLGHHLFFLSLYNINCSEDDCVAFLRARPNYARTLKTFDVSLKNMNWKLFTVATQNLTSLEEFGYCPQFVRLPATQHDSIFTDLSLLPNLDFIQWILLSVDQLRVLRLRQHWPGTLPRLTSIRQATIHINNRGENRDHFQQSELFDQLLPLLSRVFCRLEWLRIRFIAGQRNDESLREQLTSKVRQLFPQLKDLKAFYFVE